MASLPHLWRHLSVRLNVAFISTRYYFVQEQRTQVCHHANYAFIVSLLLEFLQLKCQGKADTPFDTHPRTIRVAISSLLMYGLAHDAQLRFPWARLPPSYVSFVGHAVRLVGSVSVMLIVPTVSANSTSICELQVGPQCSAEVSVASLPQLANVVGHVVRFIMSISVASLASVLVPDSAQPVLYLIYVLPSTAVFFQWFKRRVIDEVGEPDSWSEPLRRMIRLQRGQGDRYTLPLYTE
ncbi:hypothetical protein LguiA_034115 [Lonicera macranthoides]